MPRGIAYKVRVGQRQPAVICLPDTKVEAFRAVLMLFDRYDGHDESYRRFLYAILKQAVVDVALETSPPLLLDAMNWLKSPYCRDLCESIGIDYDYFRSVLRQHMAHDWAEAEKLCSDDLFQGS